MGKCQKPNRVSLFWGISSAGSELAACDNINRIIFLGTGGTIHGGVAHLGERLNGIQEVRGSIPLVSTTICLKTVAAQRFLALFTPAMRERVLVKIIRE